MNGHPDADVISFFVEIQIELEVNIPRPEPLSRTFRSLHVGRSLHPMVCMSPGAAARRVSLLDGYPFSVFHDSVCLLRSSREGAVLLKYS